MAACVEGIPMKTGPCTCALCVQACHENPGWFLPEEARLAIAAGFAPRMMRDWLEPCDELGNKERIYVLAPASEDHEGRDAPAFEEVGLMQWLFDPPTKGQCVLLTVDDRCSIHGSGFKPFQCRAGYRCQVSEGGRKAPDSNYEVARVWNTDPGRAVIVEWEEAKNG